MTQWTVYSRPECSLCEQMLFELEELLGPDAMTQVGVVDISQDAELERKYGSRIPVLMADGEFVCAYRLDAVRARAQLG
jgi:hypothetical protein